MQGLRSEHQVDEGRARRDALALLAGDAAAHADDHVRPQLLEQRATRPSSENTFSWAFSRTEQVLTSSTSASAGSSVRVMPMGGLEHVLHLAGIVLVHLAAEGFDVDQA